MKNHGAYAKIDAQLTDTLQLDAGVRYETAKMAVSAIPVFKDVTAITAPTSLNNDYWLPLMQSSELPADALDPIFVRLLGEKLVAFRLENGTVGVLAEACCHRGAVVSRQCTR